MLTIQLVQVLYMYIYDFQSMWLLCVGRIGGSGTNQRYVLCLYKCVGCNSVSRKIYSSMNVVTRCALDMHNKTFHWTSSYIYTNSLGCIRSIYIYIRRCSFAKCTSNGGQIAFDLITKKNIYCWCLVFLHPLQIGSAYIVHVARCIFICSLKSKWC